MKTLLIAALVAAPMAATAAPVAVPRPAAGTALTGCPRLAREWRGVEISLARTHAEGVGDNSAPRATLRGIEETNDRLNALMILDMMKAKGCALPPGPPSYITYFSDALSCATAELSGKKDDPACNSENWKRMGE